MERALFLAERGRGRTTPNPLVGAVVVSDGGVVLGQGAHLAAGGPHAEIVALDAAGAAARGAILYCTLEPCCHVGRTGPCVERIIRAGIRRVVAAMRDPNPRVAGGGFAYLSAHGVEVSVGIMEREAQVLNAPFVTWITARRPHVTAKSVISIDGFVGPRDRPLRLSGASADRYFHRQRAEIDAIAVGAGTVLTDDPQLTARGAYRMRPLTRVIVDWRLRVPVERRVFSTLALGPVIMLVSARAAEAQPDKLARLAARGVYIEIFASPDLGLALARLAGRDIVSLLVEGGPRLHAALFEADLVDRVECLVTPHVLAHGWPWRESAHRRMWATSPPQTLVLGDDILIECDVHRSH
jgi:diaminohydroxyphosphoribosylaminopyrimidine deaminase/5-amino-6-(5-phosphoribosylamino)uracil reductase